MASTDDRLEFHIPDVLTEEEMELVKDNIDSQTLENVYSKIRKVISDMALDLITAKVGQTFNHGFGTGQLLRSFIQEPVGEDNNVVITSTKPYFGILNRGFSGFSMRDALLNKRVKMRIPGGGIIYRTCGDNQLDPRKKSKKPSFASWYHPGIAGYHIYERVEQELKISVEAYVTTEARKLLSIAKNNAGFYNVYKPGGQKKYNIRNKGRFAKVATEHQNQQYQSPLIYRNGKYLVPGDEGYDLEEREGYAGYHTSDDYDYNT
jgi:hypothetical protein